MFCKILFILLSCNSISGLSFGFAQCIPFVAYAVVMFYGGYLVKNNEITYDDVFK